MAKPEKPRGTSKPAVKSSTIPTIKSSKTKRKSPPPPKAHLSSEFVQDSSDDDMPAVTPVKVTKPVEKSKKTPEKKERAKAAVVEVSSDSSSEESDETTSQASKSYEKITKGVAKSDSESGNDSDSDSSDKEKEDGESDDSDSSSTSIPPPSKGKSIATDSRPHTSTVPASHVSETRPAPPFQPPHGFKSVNTPSTMSKSADIFPSQATAEKQIWYITAPANVPLSSLKELALDKLVEGESVMTYKDVDYSFTMDETAGTTTSIILPNESGFKALPTEVQKVVHLRQVVKLPTAPQSEAGIPSSSLTTLPQFSVQKRTIRQQPKGLTMHYRPSGAGTGNIGTIGSSDSDEPASSRPTATVVSKKRKERDDDTVFGEKKKKKKDKHRGDREDPMEGITLSKEGLKKSKDVASSSSAINGSAKSNGVETPKKKDKEKKKKRDKGRA